MGPGPRRAHPPHDTPGGAGPYGITITPGGDVWSASLAGSHVARIDRASGRATVVEPPTRGQGARRIWSDSRGRLWVSERFIAVALPGPAAAVRQLLGRPGEVLGAASALDRLVVVQTGQ